MEEKKTMPKQKRHLILFVLLVSLGLMLGGELLGEVLVLPLRNLLPEQYIGLKFLLLYLEFIGIDLLVLLYCSQREKEILRSFRARKRGGSRGNTAKHLALGLLIGFLMNGVCILAAWLHGDLDFSIGRFRPVYLLLGLVCVLIQSGAEELLTRGYMLSALRERYGVGVAIAVSALFFGALHLLNTGITVLSFLEIVAIGAAFGLVAVCLDSLWMAVGIHTAWNFTQNLLFGLPNSGHVSVSSFLHLDAATNSLFYDATFGVEGAIPALVVTILLAVGVVWYARQRSLPLEGKVASGVSRKPDDG
ncbi:MAG: CPBP family intramembrane metalloprotease [Oscillospiraceae bacterium]|nr:CPBP family intramembrane metalloprotease [Oscillospiraceae bacterium]